MARAEEQRTWKAPSGGELSFTALGFGSACIGNYRRALSDEEAEDTLHSAWDAGLRYFDTAPFYGFTLAETRVGRLLSVQPRDSFAISTKVGRVLEPCAPEETDQTLYVGAADFMPRYDYSYDGVMRSYEGSLQRLQLNRVDILYVHDIDALVHGGREGAVAHTQELLEKGGWRALTELRSSGDVKAIGIGVNEWQPCALMLELADPDLFLLAGRYTLIENEPLTTLFPQCVERGVGVVIGGPYNSGILVGGDTYNYASAPDHVVERVRRLQAICDRFEVRMPSAALQFVLAHPAVVSVIPGPMSPDEVRGNIDYLGDTIPGEFWVALKDAGVIDTSAPVPA